jgi:hypothetical protein
VKQNVQTGDIEALRAQIENAIAEDVDETHTSSHRIEGKPMKRIILVVVVILCCALVSAAQPRKATRKNNGERLVSALVGSENVAGVFGDDGMYIFFEEPEIQRILKLGSRAIPLLIGHLDDKRLLRLLTIYADDNGERYGVTVGAACFDLLTTIIRPDSRFFDKKCLKQLDELEEGRTSSCSKPGYGILPEDFWQRKTLRVKRSVLRAKQKWANAYLNHQIHYEALK